MSPDRFHGLVRELIDENPFAVRAILRICEIRFSQSVPTLAVTCDDRPALLVNLDFVRGNCRTDNEVKAVICHELLHVLLRHTESLGRLTPARHLAFDAVINAIIHRSFGSSWSSLMARYYADVRDLRKLLRPMSPAEVKSWQKLRFVRGQHALPAWVNAWASLYEGRLIADDIAELAESLHQAVVVKEAGAVGPFTLERSVPGDVVDSLLGDHHEMGRKIDSRVSDALESAMREMNGSGIWRSPKGRGIGANAYDALFSAKPSEALTRWRSEALSIIKRQLMPDRKSRAFERRAQPRLLPVLSVSDRRAFLRARWSPFLPESSWHVETLERTGTAQVYLDVSGSMNAEMPELLALLAKLARYIRRPFWAFSDEVATATIVEGQLITRTSGGTSMECVLNHVALTRPEKALVITDGYIEHVSPELVRNAGARLFALVTRDGSTRQLEHAGIAYSQLSRLPT